MNKTPVSLAIKITLGTLFLFWVLSYSQKAKAEQYAVPHSGSPYFDVHQLEIGQILHIPTGVPVTQEQMIETVSGSRVIYVGETHDNLEAHSAQLQVLKRLHEKFPGKITIGMEMFRQSAQPDLDRWHQGNLSQKEFKKLFRENWGQGYSLYRPIFDFAKQNSMAIIGLKSSRETEARFRKDNKDAGDFPELDEKDIYHRDFSMAVFGGHGDHSEALTKPYQMLLLWEETMAQTVADFLKDETNRDRKLVVFAGGFHVQYGFGIPKRAFRRVPHAYSIILPTVTELPEELKDREMNVKPTSIPLYSGDFAWRLEYKVLPGNKVKLGVQLQEQEGDVGIKVLHVGENSNAQQAGILVGDVLLAMNGENISGVDDLIDRLQTLHIGDQAAIRLRRGMEELDVDVLLRETNP